MAHVLANVATNGKEIHVLANVATYVSRTLFRNGRQPSQRIKFSWHFLYPTVALQLAMALAYLDTASGIAGDMTLAALVDAGADREYIADRVRSLGLHQVELQFSETRRHGFRALRLDVRHPAEHAHRDLSDIVAMIDASSLSPRERDLAHRLFRKLAQAEAQVHGTTIEQVHFHEVGAIDSIVDIVGTSVALCNLSIDRVFASPTPTGCGTVQIAHGRVSVPAPATAELLRGVPIRSSQIESELTTPTGAAILSTLVDAFGPLPGMQIERIGYGAGHKDLSEQANLLRILIGSPLIESHDEVIVLEANIDDASGEQLGYAIEQLWTTGALDVYTTAIGMKKNRPGTLMSVICRPEQRARVEECIFQNTGSLGIRRTHMLRRKLHREIIRVSTNFGSVRVKVAWDAEADGSDLRFAPEYEDCRRIAQEQAITLSSVYQAAIDAARQQAWPRSAGSSENRTSPPSVAKHSGHDHDH